MEFQSGMITIAAILVAMAALAVVERLVPLRATNRWSRDHLGPNIGITLVTFTTNLMLNAPILIALLWIDAKGFGLLNFIRVPPLAELLLGIMVLDLAWYATHVTMHKSGTLWRCHIVHHSDLFVDVTTTARQHPTESLLRYVFLAAFGILGGVSVAAFAAYKVLQVAFGLLEHANIRLPARLEQAANLVVSSPSFHKVHHSRDESFTNTNYGNIFTIWDRIFGTFRPASDGWTIDYGMSGEDDASRQTVGGLLKRPFLPRPATRGHDSAC